MTDAERYRFILNSRIAQINFELDKIYSGAEFQLVNAVINSDITDYDLQKNPALKKRIEDIINKLSAVTTRIVIAGAESSWALSNKKNDDMVHKIFKGKKEIPAHYLTQTNPQNDKAFSAFIDRKTNGLNLSENVWKYNEGYKTQIENALQIGIGNGISANEMSKYLTQYLQNPTEAVAEYDDKNISAEIPQSKKAQPGVYSSPKKNAQRLARTEINMAYDTADWQRWQQLDFVVGFEVHTSGNHTTKDKNGKIVPIHDICDKLAGKYPKTFKFTGWHPQCRCYMTSILKSDEEQDEEDLAILRGKDHEEKESENIVKDVPKGFKEWVKENQERLEKSKSLPYFVRDNKEYFSEVDFKSVVKDQFEESKIEEILLFRELNQPKIKDANYNTDKNITKNDDGIYSKTDIRIEYPISKDKEYEFLNIDTIDILTEIETEFEYLQNHGIDCVQDIWKEEYIRVIDIINDNKEVNDLSEYNNSILYAANIIRLSLNSKAKSIGFENISTKMPAIILDKNIYDTPNRDIFDILKNYYPMIQSNTEVAKTIEKYNIIKININNPVYKLPNMMNETIYHEFGHIIDLETNHNISESIKTIYYEYKKIASVNYDDIARKVTDIIKNNNGLDELVVNKTDEIMRVISDIIHAMTKKRIITGEGHSDKYWDIEDNDIKECVAEFSQIYFSDNSDFEKYFEKILPPFTINGNKTSFYKEIYNLIKIFFYE